MLEWRGEHNLNEGVMVKKYYRDISSQNYSIPRRYFMDGLVSVLDIGGTYRANLDYRCRVPVGKKVHLNPDAAAIQSDWMKTGLDIYNAICEYGGKLS